MKTGGTERATVWVATSKDREKLQELLEPHHDVRVAAGNDVAGLIQGNNADLVILSADESLTGVLSSLRRRHPEPVEALVVADAEDEGMAIRSMELGSHDYLLRPLRAQEVLGRVERTLRHAKEQAGLRALADTDALTGLANFRSLTARLEQEVRRASRYGYSIAVVVVDLDHLKQLNDGFGHEQGNRAILALAEHLKKNLRDADFAARFGGDEFVALLPYQTGDEARVFAERVREGLSGLRLPLAGDQLASFQLSISAGVAATSMGQDATTAETLLARADQALYEAKRRGRNQVICAPTPRTQRESSLVQHA